MEITQEQIQAAVQKALVEKLDDILSSSYHNPIKELLEEEIKKQDGELKTLISSTLRSAFTDDTFKQKLTDKVLEKLIEKGLKS